MPGLQDFLAIVSGGFVGLSLGLVGGGGSILAVPLLIHLVGVPSTHVAIGTSAIAVAASAAISLAGHAHARTVKWPCAFVFALAGIAGAAAGAQLGKLTDSRHLLILFGLPLIKNKYVRMIPAQMVVVLVAIPLAMWLDLEHKHPYSLLGQKYEVGPQYLVDVPKSILEAVKFPDFAGLQTAAGWKWVIMFALIGTLESMLSAKAVDTLDPWKRKTNLDRDNLAIGIGNLISSSIGGLPMISEIVRSKANVDNGARTRYANMFHGLCLLSFVALVPQFLHLIPLAALGAMLVYTGLRLASPREFVKIYRVGSEQLIIFVTTIIATLATDLLIGIGIGIATKVAIHVVNGVPLRSLFFPYLEIEDIEGDTLHIKAREAAVFTNWIPFKHQIENVGLMQGRNVTLDLSDTKVVDHSVMQKLHELEMEFEQQGLKLDVIGLESHRAVSSHPRSARLKSLVPIRRITIVSQTRSPSRCQHVVKATQHAPGIQPQTMMPSATSNSSRGAARKKPHGRSGVRTTRMPHRHLPGLIPQIPSITLKTISQTSP